MRLYKPKYKARDGTERKAAKWYMAFRDHMNRRRSWPLLKDKRESEKYAERISQLCGCRRVSEPLNDELSKWLENVPDRLLKLLVEAGLIDTQRAVSGKPLTEHLTEFKVCLLADGCSKKQAGQVVSRITKIIDSCGFRSFSDVSVSEIQQYLLNQRQRSNRPMSKRTYNFYIQAIKQFSKWAEDDRRITQSPVTTLSKITVEKDDTIQRRVLVVSDLIHLLDITANQPKRFSLTGYQRSLVYRLAAETGLRANEIRNLTVGSFDFKNNTVTALGAYAKNKKLAVLPLRPDTAELIREYVQGKMPHIQLFKLTDKTAEMLRFDLEAAGIPYTDESGKVFDFHALRHQFGTMLAVGGVTPKVAQSLMRHSDINLTMGIYTHTLTGQEEAAVQSLPDLSKKKQHKTGTA